MNIRTRLRRLALLSVPLMALPALAVPLLATAPAQADATAGTAGAAAPAAAAAAAPQTVTLLTGQTVQVSASGIPSLETGGPAFRYTAANGDQYLIPAADIPYAGRQLDWSLFDISALVRDGITGSAQIPVALTFSGSAATAPPGITTTASAGLGAVGYLTPSSAPQLGAFIQSQIAADVTAGNPAGTTPLAGVNEIYLGADAPAGASPLNAYNIAQFNTPGLTGNGADAVLDVVDMDSSDTVSQAYDASDGIERIALPAGSYYVIAGYTDFDDQGNVTAVRYVSSGFTIPDGSGAPATFVNLPEATATALSTAITPRPARQINQVLSWGLTDATGITQVAQSLNLGAAGSDDEGNPGADIYVAPDTAGPASGQLRYVVEWSGIAPSPGGSFPYPSESAYPYRYDVAFGWTNQVVAGPYQVRPGQLAAVRDSLYVQAGQTPGTFAFDKAPVDPVLANIGENQIGDLWSRQAPGSFTDYVGTADGGDWELDPGIGPGWPGTTVSGWWDSSDPKTYAAGHTYSQDLGRGPLAPQFGQHRPRPQDLWLPCTACSDDTATGDTLTAQFPGDSADSDLASTGERYLYDTGSCSLNGTQISTSDNCYDNPTWAAGTTPPGQANTYQLVMDTQQSPYVAYTASTPTHTVVTFRHRDLAQPPGSMTLPPSSGYQCEVQTGPQTCEVLPVLTLSYQLAENGLSTSYARVQQLTLTVAHQEFDGVGSRAPITSATVQVSFDGGTTWQRAKVTGRDGRYQVTWINPAPARGTTPALKVTATDSIGGSISQTIDNAYTVG